MLVHRSPVNQKPDHQKAIGTDLESPILARTRSARMPLQRRQWVDEETRSNEALAAQVDPEPTPTIVPIQSGSVAFQP